MKVMLDEIARKKADAEQLRLELECRRRDPPPATPAGVDAPVQPPGSGDQGPV